jgi:hypothetical protein
LQLLNRTRFFIHGCERIAPDTHQDQAISGGTAFALAALPPQKNVGAASCPIGAFTDLWLPISGASPLLAYVAGDPFYCSVTAGGIPFRFCGWCASPLSGLPPPS